MFQTEIEEREKSPSSICLLCETAERRKFYMFKLLSEREREREILYSQDSELCKVKSKNAHKYVNIRLM